MRDPRVSLCILDEKWPPTYITVFCHASVYATVDDNVDAVTDLLFRLGAVMAGRPLDESVRDQAAVLAVREDRVGLRLRPYATFMTPPRHAGNEIEFSELTHWTSTTIPWDAD